MKQIPILDQKFYDRPSLFQPENLLREARRQKEIDESEIPEICILDPDGDISDYVIQYQNARLNKAWACYHTNLYQFTLADFSVGIIGRAVGSSFAVLVAEQLFASGCKLLVSMTSAGQLVQTLSPPYFILIEKSIRDEGTSYHYLPPADFSFLNRSIKEKTRRGFNRFSC